VLAWFRPFALPLVLIALGSALLLAMDGPDSRSGSRLPRVAIVQHAAQASIDQGVRGIVAGLAQAGFEDGRTVQLSFFNAQGDLPTANDIARRVTDGSADLIITSSTLSLQSVGTVNRTKQVPHVFGIVAGAAFAGLGISETDPMDHPPHLTGYTSLVPVIEALKLAREMNPAMRRIGLVWHSSEVSSALYTRSAREACKALGIELLEANAENTTEVGPAAQSLVSRGIDALLMTADVTVLMAADTVIKAARQGRIPVISVVPPTFRKGALFDLGNDYETLGREVGLLAAKVLAGTSPAALPVLNRVPMSLSINRMALDGLKDDWTIPETVSQRADVILDREGERRP
jgi:putative ABC transport system substrate-binding protein